MPALPSTIDGLRAWAEELREAVTSTLEDSADPANDTTPADELLLNGRAVALAIQELAARVEILTWDVGSALEELRDAIEDSGS